MGVTVAEAFVTIRPDISNFGSELQTSLQGVSGEMKKAGDETKGFELNAKELTGSLNELTEGAINPLTTAIRAGPLAAFISLGLVTADLDTKLLRISATTGLTTEKAHELSIAFEDVGGSGDVLVRAGVQIANVITQGQVSLDKGSDASLKYQLLTQKLGVAVTDSAGNMRAQGEVIEDLFAKLGTLTDKTESARIASSLFGARFAGQIIPVITNWNSVSATAAKQAGLLGDGLENSAQRGIAFHTAMTTIKTDVEAIALNFAPALVIALKALDPPLEVLAKGLQGLHALLGDVSLGAAELGAGVGFLVGGPLGALIGAGAGAGLGALATQLGLVHSKSKEAAEGTEDLSKNLEGLSSATSNATTDLKAFNADLQKFKDIGSDFNKPLDTFDKLMQSFKDAPTPQLAELQRKLSDVNVTIAQNAESYDRAETAIRHEKEAIDLKIQALDREKLGITDAIDARQRELDLIIEKQNREGADRNFSKNASDLQSQIARGAFKTSAELAEAQRRLGELNAQHNTELLQRRLKDEKAAADQRTKAIDDERKKLELDQKDKKNPFEAQKKDLADQKAIIQDQIEILEGTRQKHIDIGKEIEANRLKTQGLISDEDSLLARIDDILHRLLEYPIIDPFAQVRKDMESDLFKNFPKFDITKDIGIHPEGLPQSFQGVSSLNQRFTFGGARAEGGDVSPGSMYLTGEHGAEPFVPTVAGRILPSLRKLVSMINPLMNQQSGSYADHSRRIQVNGNVIFQTSQVRTRDDAEHALLRL